MLLAGDGKRVRRIVCVCVCAAWVLILNLVISLYLWQPAQISTHSFYTKQDSVVLFVFPLVASLPPFPFVTGNIFAIPTPLRNLFAGTNCGNTSPRMLPEMLLQSLQQPVGEYRNILLMSPSPMPTVTDMTVLERQVARLNCQQQLQQQQQAQPPPPPPSFLAVTPTSLNPNPFAALQPPHLLPSGTTSLQTTDFGGQQGIISHELPSECASVWPDLTRYSLVGDPFVSGAGINGDGLGNPAVTNSRTTGCFLLVGNAEPRERSSANSSKLEHPSTTTVPASLSTVRTMESSKKRKPPAGASTQKLEEDNRGKRIKVESFDTMMDPLVCPPIPSSCTAIATKNNSKGTSNGSEASNGSPKEKSKAADPLPKVDYIHVRARRGQATDSHSLAERVRREKISERMKFLQELVPGCNKITGKAGMLDEIINYVQSLQRQVEFLSMKLAAVTPALDFHLDRLLTKEMIAAASGGGFPAPPMGMTTELLDLAFLQFNPLQQQAVSSTEYRNQLPVPPMTSSGSQAEAAPQGVAATTPVSLPETCSLTGSSNVHRPLTTYGWDGGLQRFLGTEEFPQAVPAASSDAAVGPSFQPGINPR